MRNIVLGGLLVLALIATGVAFTYHEFEQSQYRDRVALASEMQLLSQRLATGTLEAAGGSEQAITDITELRNRFDDQLERLRDGGDGLLPLPEAVSSELAAVNRECRFIATTSPPSSWARMISSR